MTGDLYDDETGPRTMEDGGATFGQPTYRPADDTRTVNPCPRCYCPMVDPTDPWCPTCGWSDPS